MNIGFSFSHTKYSDVPDSCALPVLFRFKNLPTVVQDSYHTYHTQALSEQECGQWPLWKKVTTVPIVP